jgi:hypothetical protein
MKACLDVAADWLERHPPVLDDGSLQSEQIVT